MMDRSPATLARHLGKRKRGPSSDDDEQVATQRHRTSPYRRPACRQEFEIAVICALPLEYDAVCLLFDEFWDGDRESYGRASGDRNSYTTGRIRKHNVVLVLLYRMGKATAAGAAASMQSSYTGLRVAFLVGICGGVPCPRDREEIVLGDVVISKTVIQYDFGRQYPGHFARKEAAGDILGGQSKDIRNMLALLETRRGRSRLQSTTAKYLKELQTNASIQEVGHTYAYPGVAEDKLYNATYRHKHRSPSRCGCFLENHEQLGLVCAEAITSSCEELGCDASYLVTRGRLCASTSQERDSAYSSRDPAIHVGPVASGDAVMKSGEDRDRIAANDGVIAFEMEGAGAWEEVPSVVIKGVCDYADCHKHKRWQRFAAATAASAMKGLLNLWVYRDDAPRSGRLADSWPNATPGDAEARVRVRDHHVIVTLERASQITHVIPWTSHGPRDQPSFHRVTVIDARGMPLPFYLETVTSKQLFTHILKERFGDLGTGKIDRNEWMLEDRDTGQILDLSAPWLSLFKPNQVLFMTMIFRRRKTPSTRCPSCSFSNYGTTDTETQCKRCGLFYQRVQEVQKYEVFDRERSTSPPPVPTNIPPEATGPQKPQHYTAEDDISQYRRVSVIDTTFQIDKASCQNGTASPRMLLTAKDLHEVEALARRLALVSGLSVSDCSALLQDYELTLSSIRDEFEAVHQASLAPESREDYDEHRRPSSAERMVIPPNTALGEGPRFDFPKLSQTLEGSNAQFRSLLEMTDRSNRMTPPMRDSLPPTLRRRDVTGDAPLSGTAPWSSFRPPLPIYLSSAAYINSFASESPSPWSGLMNAVLERDVPPPPLPPPRVMPFTRLTTTNTHTGQPEQGTRRGRPPNSRGDGGYHPAPESSASNATGQGRLFASSTANEPLGSDAEHGAERPLFLRHGPLFSSAADFHAGSTLQRLDPSRAARGRRSDI
ncbi:hypothetical protein JDV02_001732 [Purpureocillium takamizusanense]|uniref:Nucleoside phosphorylase domain-containing protein n=1 Tax=Purpureocillium takamizusanense TaxID=2060973 RepID=A0A9Q8V7T9_9HYPO|nr:uncharacterized protein JDV02_001732 [Purpureocillium takamizusanense]UNI15169.1 hypothetical protein JDV02_001732 [Purpureocillium takamizusanense]